MPNKEENSGISSGKFPSREFKGITEYLRMDTWHFLYVIREMQLKRKGIKLEHSFIAFSFFIALLMSMIPSDFKDFLNIKAEIWQWLALTFTVLSFIAFLILFWFWFKNKKNYVEQTPEQILEEVKSQIRCDDLAKLGKTK